LLIFNYALGRWSIGNVDADFVAPFFSAGYTVEDLDNLSATLDGLSTVLDSQLFRGGEFFFGGAVGDKLFTFTGDPLQATITTGEATLSMGKHSIVTRVYPYHEDGTVELFVGLTMGMIIPFMNVFYLYRLGTSREFFGNVAALAVLPVMLATIIGPAIAKRLTNIGAVRAARWLIPASMLLMAATTNAYLGTAGYWAYRALFVMSQSIWFAFVIDTAAPRGKAAASAWLEITFWIGMAIAAPATGFLLARQSYTLPSLLSAAAAVVTGFLTDRCARVCQAPSETTEEAQSA